MPIYLDRHDTPEEITPEHVAEMHQADLKIQDKYGCRGFTYWYDDKRKSGFCLIEAPNKEALIKMHDHAHGAVPHQIIEVEENMVEAFLGRLGDPKKAKNEKLNIIDEPAFRILMVLKINSSPSKNKSLDHSEINKVIDFIVEKSDEFKGRMVENKGQSILLSFNSVSNAIHCVKEIHHESNDSSAIAIGLHCGIPVTDKKGIFEETITLANRMCTFCKGDIVTSSDVKELYELENVNKSISLDLFSVLDTKEQRFLNAIVDYTEENWNRADFKVEDFSTHLGLSKSQVYRKLRRLNDSSPNAFIKDYRLTKAMQLLKKKEFTVSEIAFKTGFNSSSYFSKCFQEKYRTLPSSYVI